MKISARLGILAVPALLIAASPGDEMFDQTLISLAQGARAQTQGNRIALRRAGTLLSATGAQPAETQADLAQRWGGKAPGPPMRNRILGPAYRSISLAGGASEAFEQVFYAGQHARAALVPTSGSGFIMTVRDDQQAAVCTASSRDTQCNWIPTYTTRYNIEIHNPAKRKGEVFLIVR